jgi:hypothetical protein
MQEQAAFPGSFMHAPLSVANELEKYSPLFTAGIAQPAAISGDFQEQIMRACQS